MAPFGIERGVEGSTRKHERADPEKDGRGERWEREEREAAAAPAPEVEPEEVSEREAEPDSVSAWQSPFPDPGPDLDPDDLPAPPASVVELDAPETAAPEGGSGIPGFGRSAPAPAAPLPAERSGYSLAGLDSETRAAVQRERAASRGLEVRAARHRAAERDPDDGWGSRR